MKTLLDLKFHDSTDAEGVEFRCVSTSLRFPMPDGSIETINVQMNLDDPKNKDWKKMHDQLILDILALKSRDDSTTSNIKAITEGNIESITLPNRKGRRAITKIKKSK